MVENHLIACFKIKLFKMLQLFMRKVSMMINMITVKDYQKYLMRVSFIMEYHLPPQSTYKSLFLNYSLIYTMNNSSSHTKIISNRLKDSKKIKFIYK
jgi:hypothetical protein